MMNSAFSTLVDFGITFLLQRVLGFWYIMASVTGALTGGILNFTLAHYWVFRPGTNRPPDKQDIVRYLGVWTGSLLLNTGLLYALTEGLGIYYLLSKLITVVAVGIGFNFFMQKNFVFGR